LYCKIAFESAVMKFNFFGFSLLLSNKKFRLVFAYSSHMIFFVLSPQPKTKKFAFLNKYPDAKERENVFELAWQG
jgi:hypothetical protein